MSSRLTPLVASSGHEPMMTAWKPESWADGRPVDVYTARTLDAPFAGKQWDFGGPYGFANFGVAFGLGLSIVGAAWGIWLTGSSLVGAARSEVSYR